MFYLFFQDGPTGKSRAQKARLLSDIFIQSGLGDKFEAALKDGTRIVEIRRELAAAVADDLKDLGWSTYASERRGYVVVEKF